MEIKALACERPADLGLPLARLSVAEIARVAVARDIVEAISTTTVWRWLREDALKPWTYRTWIFPRDPDFERKAGLILDLYGGRFEGEALRPDEHVVCADEKTSIQARARIHPGSPPAPGLAGRVEHEYERRAHFADVPIRLSPVATTGSGQGFDAVVGAAGTNFLRRFRVPVCCCDSV